MTVPTYTLTGDLSTLLGADLDPKRVGITLASNVPDRAIRDTDGNRVLLGSGSAVLGDDGSLTIAGIPDTSSEDLIPTGFQLQLSVDYPAGSGRRAWLSGWFSMTGDADLATLETSTTPALAPPTWESTFTAAMDALQAATEAAKDAALAAQAAAETARDQATALGDMMPVLPLGDISGTVDLTDIVLPKMLTGRLVGDVSIEFGDLTAIPSFTIGMRLKQDPTGGRTLIVQNGLASFSSAVTLSTAANAVDLVWLLWDGVTLDVLSGATALGIPASWIV